VEAAGDRAEMTARADEHRSGDLSVQHPLAILAFNTGHSGAQGQPRAGTTQQVLVELATPDAVADGAPVRYGGRRPAINLACSKTRDGLERASAPVLVHVELQIVQDRGRNPAGAGLVS